MKTIEVVAAVIGRENKILATRRGYGEFINLWEFPGGKIERGEEKEAALVREIQEELGVTVKVERFLTTVNYDYPNFHLIMHCYMCIVEEGSFEFKEHNAWKWLKREDLDSVEWLPADIAVVEVLRENWL